MRYLILVIFLISCGPAHDLAKAKRLIDRAKAHGAIVTSDTVYSESIVYKKGDSTTVFVPVHIKHDTTITQYQDRIRLVYTIKKDTVRMTVKCPDDTVHITKVQTITEKIQPPATRFWKSEWFWLALALAALLVLALTRRR